MKNIFLVGYMGVGKSTVGKKLARILGLEFIDLDILITKGEQLSMAQLMDSLGNDDFRKLETKYLKKVIKKRHVLVSTGGGTPCFFDNMEIINANGTSIYLEMDEKSIVNRLINHTESRPLIAGMNKLQLSQFVDQHLAGRKPYYEKAHKTVNALSFNAQKMEELAQQLALL